jgi:hypothetical protein
MMETDFQVWMRAMGFHGKQIAHAGRLIGHGNADTSQKTNKGDRELTHTERLAMAAVRAGLPAWTPQTDQEIADVGELRNIMERAASRQTPRSSDDVPNAA